MISLRNTLKNAAALFGMCLMLCAVNSQAANLTVSTTADAGVGSLRQAILDAQSNAEANTVTFAILTTDPGFNAAENRFTINLANTLPNIPLAPMTINNNQPQAVTVKGNNSFRIFTLVDSAVVIINNLTISNGTTREQLIDGFNNAENGGGIFMGDSSTLALNGSSVSDNAAFGDGGGIYMGNSATLFLNNTTINRNTASNGGGIYINDSGTLNINTSTINANSTAFGGDGGGIFNGTSGTINATSSTIDGNNATGGDGGGIYNTATITFTDNTVTANNANRGGGIYNNFTATLANNLVALNTATEGADLLGSGTLGDAFVGTYNFVGNADGSEGLAFATNQLGTTLVPIDPVIGLLSNNGGSTFTRPLLSGSPAIDKGNSPSITTDQRGRNRVVDNPDIANAAGGNGSDIGAFEAQLVPTAASVIVSGRVLTKTGRGIVNVRLSLTDLSGNVKTTTTTASGFYHFDNVESGFTYILSVIGKRYTFNQPQQLLNVIAETDHVDFIANAEMVGKGSQER